MKLADLQAQFQAALIHGDPAVLDVTPDEGAYRAAICLVLPARGTNP